LEIVLFGTVPGISSAQTPSTLSAAWNYVHDVYPFLGVDWGGNTFVGSALPFSMLKLGPLIAMSGGNDTFIRHLDHIFLRQHFDVTNEPGFLIRVLYNWAGRPDKTADIDRSA